MPRDETDQADALDELEAFKAAEDLDELPLDPDSGTVQAPAGWEIEDDQHATRILYRLRRIRTELQRHEDAAKVDKAETDLWLKDVRRPLEAKEAFYESALVQYRRKLADEATEEEGPFPLTYKVRGGEIWEKAGATAIEIDDADALVAWAVDNAHLELVDMKPETKTKLGELLEAAVKRGKRGRSDNAVLSPAGRYPMHIGGEVVPGVVFVVKDPSEGARPA